MRLHTLAGILIVSLSFACNSSAQRSGPKKAAPVKVEQRQFPTNFLKSIPDKTYAGLAPASLSPDVVKIDADAIYNVINGACIISKGPLYALIDLDGHFLIPWGKYKFKNTSKYFVSYTGLISVENPTGFDIALLNSKGDLVANGMTDFNYDGIAEVTLKDRWTRKYFTKDGKQLPDMIYTPETRWLSDMDFYQMRPVDNRIRYYPKIPGNSKNKVGFLTNDCQPAFSQLFEDAGQFVDGMCCVKQTDQFGVARWGYIDVSGKLVIPYTFRIKPGNFHDGLALVQPAEGADFSYAYIDKRGNIKIKIGTTPRTPPCFPAGIDDGGVIRDRNVADASFFVRGLAFWKSKTMFQDPILCDLQGRFHTLANLSNDPNINRDSLRVETYDDRHIYFYDHSKKSNGNSYGLMDYKGNTVFPPVFNFILPDRFSSYAVARVNLPYDRNTAKTPVREGIVNRQGVFILILDNHSTF